MTGRFCTSGHTRQKGLCGDGITTAPWYSLASFSLLLGLLVCPVMATDAEVVR